MRRNLVPIAALVLLTTQIALSVVALRTPPDLYDQGVYLASARFAADGLVPYRDFYFPYGPGLTYLDALLIWANLDHVVAHRLLWASARFLLSLVVLELARRRGLLPLGVAIVATLLLEPVPPAYVFPLLIFVSAVAHLSCRPARTGWALTLIGAVVWFRWEYAALVALAAFGLVATEAGRRRATVLHGIAALLLGVAPYALILTAGGLPGFRATIEYALGPFAEHRGLPYPWTAPGDIARALVSGRAGDLIVDYVRFVAYLLAPLALLATLIARWTSGDLRDRIREPATVLALSLGVVALYSLRVRPDPFHAAPLTVALGVALLMVVDARSTSARNAAILTAAGAMALVVPNMVRLWQSPSQQVPGFDRVVAEARRVVEPGDQIFVANRDNSTTYVNAPLLYWALEARPAHPIFQFEPGFADDPRVQQLIVKQLCRSRPAVILWDAPTLAATPAPTTPDPLDDFLLHGYREVLREGEFSLLAPLPAPAC